jgi:hypothetical protein
MFYGDQDVLLAASSTFIISQLSIPQSPISIFYNDGANPVGDANKGKGDVPLKPHAGPYG